MINEERGTEMIFYFCLAGALSIFNAMFKARHRGIDAGYLVLSWVFRVPGIWQLAGDISRMKSGKPTGIFSDFLEDDVTGTLYMPWLIFEAVLTIVFLTRFRKEPHLVGRQPLSFAAKFLPDVVLIVMMLYFWRLAG
ncbi:MAG TPA: hypothetical protein VK171_16700 [Fimbriimonas sp.]|nr:hypothetical protein [Fimbriimonas sp.]